MNRLVAALLPDVEQERLRSIPIRDRGFGYDLFGCERESMELAYVGFSLLYERYFRVESRGHEHVPREGACIVAANHSGVLPIDGTMIAVDLVKRMDPPRFYRAVVDNYAAAVPYVGVFMQRVGQVIGTRRNFKELLEAGEMVGVFPEGAKGTGKPFARRYKLLRFNVGFVELSLLHRVPIVPCSVVGAEEQAPMLLDLKPIARLIGAPYFPLTPTFPLLGPLGAIPYPSRYHLRYGEPIRLYEELDADEALEDPRILRELAQGVRERIQGMVDATLAERRSVYF